MCHYFTSPYCPTNKLSKSVTVRPSRFIILNDSVGRKMPLKIDLKIIDGVTYIWLLIGTSFASLTRNKIKHTSFPKCNLCNQWTILNHMFEYHCKIKNKMLMPLSLFGPYFSETKSVFKFWTLSKNYKFNS